MAFGHDKPDAIGQHEIRNILLKSLKILGRGGKRHEPQEGGYECDATHVCCDPILYTEHSKAAGTEGLPD
jgi:hypothetical protein